MTEIEEKVSVNVSALSVNQQSAPIVKQLIARAEALNIGILTHETGCTVIDAGIHFAGCAEAGKMIAEICMGGLGKVSLVAEKRFANFTDAIEVSSDSPVISCLGSQYAGWALSHEKFFSLGSGPARALAQREDVFKDIAYQDTATQTCIVLETDKVPPKEVIEKVLRDTHMQANQLTIILTPTTSVAGTVQIVGRVLEVALHKAHTLHFALENIVSGTGLAVLPPVAKDFMTAMGRTNDAILFGGFVELNVRGGDDEAKKLADQLPSSASKDYGKTFAEVFKFYDMDFYKIDPMLFSPAKVKVTNLDTGNAFEAGALNEALIDLSFKD
jgi:methenyltetrahydromethanopterin cyclohydrolase